MRNFLKKLIQWEDTESAPIELKENCLLTRFPILLIGSNWGNIPQVLKDHGYPVEISSVLRPLHQKTHLMISDQFCPILLTGLKEDVSCASLTRVTRTPPDTFESTLYWPEGLSLITERELWLQHIISLAEKDLVRED